MDSWDKSGTFNCGSFDGDIENPQWAYNAAKFLKEEYGAELPLIGVYATDNIN
ncbi:MAG: hypothetical protein K2K41_09075 [Ruminiclostridium sp.]|nr:hypothetical protein [Ruminiclostridium sp.]